MPPTQAIRVGLISDTHGLLRPAAMAFLQGSDFIVHGGDVGRGDILEKLAEIAPVTAVCGNIDSDPCSEDLPQTAVLRAGTVAIFVIHNLTDLRHDLAANRYQVVVSGHTHRPAVEWRNGILYVNPGSAGPRRFKLPVSIGQLLVAGSQVTPELLELAID